MVLNPLIELRISLKNNKISCENLSFFIEGLAGKESFLEFLELNFEGNGNINNAGNFFSYFNASLFPKLNTLHLILDK